MNVRWVGGYKNAPAAHREDERDQRKPRKSRRWKPRDPFKPDTPPVRKPSRYSERDGRLVYDHPKRGTLDVSRELRAGRSKRSRAPRDEAAEMLGFRDHLDEARARSRGMNKGRPHQPAFISGDNLVGRVLDADERARVKRAEGRKSSPRRKPTMPRFSFSGKPIPEERVDEWTREQAAVRRAAKTVRERSGYSIRASVNIADTKTKGGTQRLRNLRGVRKWIRPADTPFGEDALDELYGKGRFGEIRRHAQYKGDAPTVARADAIIDDTDARRRAELRAKSRTWRHTSRRPRAPVSEGTESYHLRLAGHHEDQASEHDKDSAKYKRHVDAANRHYDKAFEAAERTRPRSSQRRKKK